MVIHIERIGEIYLVIPNKSTQKYANAMLRINDTL